jgi:hypothetical protein
MAGTESDRAVDKLINVELPAARERHDDLSRSLGEFSVRWTAFLRASGQLTDETEEQRRRRTLERRQRPTVRYRVD